MQCPMSLNYICITHIISPHVCDWVCMRVFDSLSPEGSQSHGKSFQAKSILWPIRDKYWLGPRELKISVNLMGLQGLVILWLAHSVYVWVNWQSCNTIESIKNDEKAKIYLYFLYKLNSELAGIFWAVDVSLCGLFVI